MSRALAVANVALTVAYPFLVWWSLAHWSARSVGLLALALLLPTFAWRVRRAPPSHRCAALRVPAVVFVVLGLAAVFDDARWVLAMPVVVSLALLALFGASLRAGATPVVESFARLEEPRLDAAQVAHCRQATVAWSVFFVLNAATAGALALSGARDAWAVYTGGVAYALMGGLFAGEYVVRQARFRRYGRGLHDRLLARVFPPRATDAGPGEGA